MLHSLLQPMWDLTIYSLEGLASSLAYRTELGSDTICNRPSPLVIVHFCLLYIVVSLIILKRVY